MCVCVCECVCVCVCIGVARRILAPIAIGFPKPEEAVEATPYQRENAKSAAGLPTPLHTTGALVTRTLYYNYYEEPPKIVYVIIRAPIVLHSFPAS